MCILNNWSVGVRDVRFDDDTSGSNWNTISTQYQSGLRSDDDDRHALSWKEMRWQFNIINIVKIDGIALPLGSDIINWKDE